MAILAKTNKFKLRPVAILRKTKVKIHKHFKNIFSQITFEAKDVKKLKRWGCNSRYFSFGKQVFAVRYVFNRDTAFSPGRNNSPPLSHPIRGRLRVVVRLGVVESAASSHSAYCVLRSLVRDRSYLLSFWFWALSSVLRRNEYYFKRRTVFFASLFVLRNI